MSSALFSQTTWTASRAIATLATVIALVFVLGPAFPLTLASTLAIGVLAVIVSHAIHKREATYEFVTSFTVPLLGLLIVITPAVTVYETHGVLLEPIPVLMTAGVGVTAAAAAAIIFPLAAGGFKPDLPRLMLGLSGQLFAPLGVAVFLVYVLEQERVLDRAPHPEYIYTLIVAEPIESGTVAPLLVTSGLLWILIGLIGFLLRRPLEYGWVYPEEWEGQMLARLSRYFFGLAFVIVFLGWLSGFLLMLATRSDVDFPAGIWLFLDTMSAIAEHQTLVLLLMNMILVYLVAAIIVSPLFVMQWVERTNTLWLIRHVFSGALALIVGLTATYFTREAILGSPSTLETMDEVGDPAWLVFDWLAVLFTGLPFLGAVVIFCGAMVYVTIFERSRGTYPLYIVYRNVGVGALFVLTVLAVAEGTPVVFGLLAAGAALVAWDTFEYSYTLQVELPDINGVSANELVHAGGIAGVAAISIVLALVVNLLVSPLAVDSEGMLLAAFFILTGSVIMLFAIRE